MNENVDPDAVAKAAPAFAATPARRRYRLGKIALAFTLAAAAIFAFQHFEKIGVSTLPDAKTNASGPPPQTVRVAEVATGDMPIFIDALGTVTPLATVTVKTQIAGRLMEVGFTEGQIVKEGDFLAQIDSRPFEATRAQVEAQLAKDTALYQQAQADLARYQTLKQQDSISHQQVEDQVFLVAQDKAAMANDQAQIDAAKLNIYYTRIVSPIAGRVGLRLVDAGNYVQPSDSTGLVVITQIDPISVVFSPPEDYLPRITRRLESGAKLPVTAYDRSNVRELATGEMTTFDNQIDTTTGTFRIRATFPNPDNALFPNQFVNVRLLVDTQKGVVVAPNAAVQPGASGAYVYVAKDDDTVAVRQIKTGAADATRAVVTSGLSVGEKVVIDGVDRLREGSKIKVVGATSSPSAQTPGTGEKPHRRGAGQGEGAAAPAPPPSPSPSSKP